VATLRTREQRRHPFRHWLCRGQGLFLLLVLTGTLGTASVAALELELELQLEINEFTLRLTDANGQLAYILEGSRMLQTEERGAGIQQRADQPRLQILDAGTVDWIWQSESAVHYPLEQRWFLAGETHGLRLPGVAHPRTEINTRDVTIWADSQQIATDARSILTQPGLFMTGLGLRADITTGIIQLLSFVRTVYAQLEEHEGERVVAP